jgi:hypothetical protein
MSRQINKRPVVLSVICVIGFVWVLFNIPSMFSPEIKRLSDWYPALIGIITAINFICYIGVWYMKKWGVELFLLNFFADQSLFIAIGKFGALHCFMGTVSLILFLIFYRKMDQNL